MTEIVAKESRVKRLQDFGLPQVFIENIGNIEELEFRVESEDSAYYYLPSILNYDILVGKEVTPIFCCGVSFTVLLQENDDERIVYFELECDEIYRDYGTNVELLLMDIMIEYYDDTVEDGVSLEDFIQVGNKIGFAKSEELYRLRNLSVEEYNEKYEDVDGWRIEIAEALGVV
ncbi:MULTISPECIES: hypothetical protein [Myroides]|uniref:DUF402 domain-containing protein n=1 Tax=Myroides odoratimimus TaxID=76832 RepID=A0AAI8C5Z1_9FLAO|nr:MULTISPECIES: hypothetical protein [Myroides]ALU26727.1 hypothetical protein AS202_11465 [Myroides odoratimimus]APA92746.1 hypothetical protein BK054_11070 [Myroides sp. ZB35]MDM1035094.1 hypothetical protein [Myroides odoratimimus]MDM1037794.1 hypothetical protein [Myroides odoratimimus]MDM1052073.1 hypothetical protein [Myroides odoratimimus]